MGKIGKQRGTRRRAGSGRERGGEGTRKAALPERLKVAYLLALGFSLTAGTGFPNY